MILMRENPFRGPLEGWALKIKTFLGPEMATSKAQKSLDFRGPRLPMALEMDYLASTFRAK
jgi:hypothetical protein